MGNCSCYKVSKNEEEINLKPPESKHSLSDTFNGVRNQVTPELGSIVLEILEGNNSEVETLRVLWRELNESSCLVLGLALQELPCLKEITLKDNLIGHHFSKLKSGLAYCASLTKLSITKNNLGNEGAGVLEGVLPNLVELEELILEDNGISDEGAQYLAVGLSRLSKFRLLWVQRNQIKGPGLIKLAQTLHKIQSFEELHFDSEFLSAEEIHKVQELVPRIIVNQV